jgi:hypothetical protein
MDLWYAGKPAWFVLGPIAPTDDAELANTLDRIAQGGPNNRLGLLPSRNSRRWRLVTEPGKAAVLPPCPVACGSLDEAVAATVKVRPGPIAVWRCGDYLCVYYDHGLGDARFIQRVVAALTDPAAVASFDLRDMRFVRHPFGLALWKGLRTEPSKVLRDALSLRKMLIGRVRGSVVPRRSGPDTADAVVVDQMPDEELTTVVASSGPTYIEELRGYRDATHSGLSTTTLVMYSICKSLQQVGADVAPNIEILTDLRRFLPRRSVTLANFCGVAKVPFSAHTTPEDFRAALTTESTSYRQILKLVGVLPFLKLRYSRRRRPMKAERLKPSAENRTVVTISDYTKIAADAQIRWADSARAESAVVIEAEGRRHIAMVLSSSGDNGLRVTASFYRSHIDQQTVRRALNQALSPQVFHMLEDMTSSQCAGRVAH